jgi:uncharacterized membrane protein
MDEETFSTSKGEPTKLSEAEMIEEGKAAAILAYIPFMCFVPLIKMKDNSFAVKHGKQGLLLLIVEILAIVFLLPKISELFWTAVVILCVIFALVGILYALQGKTWKMPYIGDFADKLKI